MSAITRRELIAGLACTGVAARSTRGSAQAQRTRSPNSSPSAPFDVVRPPDAVSIFLGLAEHVRLSRQGARWEARGMRVRTEAAGSGLQIWLSASGARPTHVRVRWNIKVPADVLVLGDHWERSYGDLQWNCLVPERVMPWYFLVRHPAALHGYGVRTSAAALCFWQVDPDGVSLWLNVCNGGNGVELGERELHAATVVSRLGKPGEEPIAAAKAFCSTMCDGARPAPRLVYGSNDWYYAYGKNTADEIVRDAELMASLAPTTGERPVTIIDDGWQDRKAFPDMPGLARAIRQRNVQPGLWIRPLQAPSTARPALLLPKERFRSNRRVSPAYDPTNPDALDVVLATMRDAVAWGYDVVKHDYSTYELFGQWGFEMHAQPALPGWSFSDRTRTNAEIVRQLYADLRRAAGDRTIIIGCNTIGHLAAGLFEIQRTGDDTSGTNWERTRRMGVNTLAYRLPQHRTLFLLDPDCVPITSRTPWSCNRQWMDLVARSGTVLFVSAEKSTLGDEQRSAIREAFEVLQSAGEHVRPADWQTTTTPGRWEFENRETRRVTSKSYDWYEQAGAWPFEI